MFESKPFTVTKTFTRWSCLNPEHTKGHTTQKIAEDCVGKAILKKERSDARIQKYGWDSNDPRTTFPDYFRPRTEGMAFLEEQGVSHKEIAKIYGWAKTEIHLPLDWRKKVLTHHCTRLRRTPHVVELLNHISTLEATTKTD